MPDEAEVLRARADAAEAEAKAKEAERAAEVAALPPAAPAAPVAPEIPAAPVPAAAVEGASRPLMTREELTALEREGEEAVIARMDDVDAALKAGI